MTMTTRWVFILSLLIAPGAHAEFDHVSEAERAALIRLIHVLDSAQLLIDQAKHSQVSDTRFALEYDPLRADLKLVRDALYRHITKPARTPRRLPPLQGDYTYRSQ